MGKKERYGVIYKITNTVNGKVYIGQTIHDFNKRYHSSGNGIERVYKHHKYNKEHNRSYNVHLLGAIEKYGFEAFDVIEEFDVARNKEELDSLECKYIKEFNCIENGYNNREGGSDGKHSEEVCKKISNNHWNCKGEKHPMYGKHHSMEARKKMSESRKGKYCGENHPMYGNHKFAGENNPMYGKHRTKEQKRKQSEAMKGKYCGENHPRARKIKCITDGNTFNSMKECAEYYKKDIKTIGKVCKHEQEQTKDGLVFAYYDEYIQQQEQTV